MFEVIGNLFWMLKSSKRGSEGWQIYKLVIAVIVLAVLILGGIFLLTTKGGDFLDFLRNFMRFGR